ncbi:relaxase/mobilization nuclease domain-containing protein [Actinomyces faecalis]|uniref:relaxase/mobilization nuclease domain-containing protein n=1 Tax=Actinomyces faecalis TaxID=2722820 RepID=UPI001554B1AE|nr:relaxase/mobilization nuclease domain-containing protein [Actinomyces faecalis]
MIPAIVQGGSTPGLLNYLVGPGRSNEHESPHVVAGSDIIMRRWGAWDELSPAQGYEIAKFVDQYMTELGIQPTGSVRTFNHATGKVETAADRPNHVWHCSLSLSPEEGPLSEDKWRAIATDFMAEMGFTGVDGKAPCRWVAIHHGASKNGGDHIHIAANIVREDGTKWSPWQDQRRAQRTANQLEHKYGLMVIESREHRRGARADSAADLRATQRRQADQYAAGRGHEVVTDRARLEARVRAAAVAAVDEPDFVIRLRETGVRVRPRFAAGRTDVVVGYCVALHSTNPLRPSQWYGGGRLARDLSLTRLRTRWMDTPVGAQMAVQAWQAAWRGDKITSSPIASPMSAWHAAADSLRTWDHELRSINPYDPVALADATRDVSGLLAAAGVATTNPAERATLMRAARVTGRHAQTHTRPRDRVQVPGAVLLAARTLSLTVKDQRVATMLLAAETMQLVHSLASLYQQAQQTQTAAALLRDTAAAWELTHAQPLPPTSRQHAQAQAARLAALPAPAATDTLPPRAPITTPAPGSLEREAAALTDDQAQRIRSIAAIATVSTPAQHSRTEDSARPWPTPPPTQERKQTL